MQDIKKITIGFPQYFATLLSLIREKRCKFLFLIQEESIFKLGLCLFLYFKTVFEKNNFFYFFLYFKLIFVKCF
jgi:hypothetical protein